MHLRNFDRHQPDATTKDIKYIVSLVFLQSYLIVTLFQRNPDFDQLIVGRPA